MTEPPSGSGRGRRPTEPPSASRRTCGGGEQVLGVCTEFITAMEEWFIELVQAWTPPPERGDALEDARARRPWCRVRPNSPRSRSRVLAATGPVEPRCRRGRCGGVPSGSALQADTGDRAREVDHGGDRLPGTRHPDLCPARHSLATRRTTPDTERRPDRLCVRTGRPLHDRAARPRAAGSPAQHGVDYWSNALRSARRDPVTADLDVPAQPRAPNT